MEQRVQARTHYCDDKKGELYVPGAVETSKPVNPLRAWKTSKVGSWLYAALRKVYVALYIPGIFRPRYSSNNKLGLYITAACNLSCDNCQVSARQAPSGDIMTVDQMKRIVADAIALKYYWSEIFVTGGEPTLHPQFFEVLDTLKPYLQFNPECVVTLETAGAGKKVQSVLDKMPSWVVVHNTSKMEGRNDYGFVAYNVAPADSLKYSLFADYSKGCRRLTEAYGLCASMYGFYPVSPCMNVDRVFGFDIGIKSLAEVNDKALRAQMKQLCRNCGWFREETLSKHESAPIQSKSWKRAFANYKKQRPILSKLLS